MGVRCTNRGLVTTTLSNSEEIIAYEGDAYWFLSQQQYSSGKNIFEYVMKYGCIP